MYPWLQFSSLAAASTLRCAFKDSQTFLSGMFSRLRPKPLTTTDLPQCGHWTFIGCYPLYAVEAMPSPPQGGAHSRPG